MNVVTAWAIIAGFSVVALWVAIEVKLRRLSYNTKQSIVACIGLAAGAVGLACIALALAMALYTVIFK